MLIFGVKIQVDNFGHFLTPCPTLHICYYDYILPSIALQLLDSLPASFLTLSHLLPLLQLVIMDAVYVNGGEVAASNGMAQAQHVLNWNPKQLDIKTKSVEKTLEPLVLQVGTISLLFHKNK